MADKPIKVKCMTKTKAQFEAITDKPLLRGIESDTDKFGWWDAEGAWHRSAEVDTSGNLIDPFTIPLSAATEAAGQIIVVNDEGYLEYQPAITAGKIIVADANGRPVAGTNSNTEVASAVTNSHSKSRLTYGLNSGAVVATSETEVIFGYQSSASWVKLAVDISGNISLRPAGSSGAGRGLAITASATDPGTDPLTLAVTENVMPRKLAVSGTVRVNDKIAMNPDGGLMVKLTNKTGAASVKGNIVTAGNTCVTDDSFQLCVINVPDVFGVVYEAGIADGQECWVVISGIADVYYVGSTTRGYLARGFVTGEAGYVTGQAIAEAVPSTPFATDKHFYEVGHVIQSRTGAGLARTVLHFN